MTNFFFVLGAPDHEMQEIQRVCVEKGYAYAYATTPTGSVVHTHDAYSATGIGGVIPAGAHVVLVECGVMGLPSHDVIDHHQPGDPGYGKTPEQFMQGASLGQFLDMTGQVATPLQRIIAAADHCLTAAYAGLCPGIDPDELRQWRELTRSKARRLPIDVLVGQITEAMTALRNAPTYKLAGADVAWFEHPPAEVSEASARLAMPYSYLRQQDDGRVKAGIRSAPAAVIKLWLDTCGLKSTYGDPQRGFAGGYF